MLKMNDLLVVGAGHLGTRVAVLWRNKFPDCQIYLKTKSDNPERSEKWKSLGYVPVSSATEPDSIPKFPYVVFSVPPTAEDAMTSYPADIEDSIKSHLATDGVFAFTSSGGVYTENSGNIVNEQSVVAAAGRNKAILDGEAKVLAEKNGFVLRFGGLYTSNRGAHSFWLRSGKTEFPSPPNGLINMIHYDDAAKCVVEALLSPGKDEYSERLFLVADGVPISRQDICKAALKHPAFAGMACPAFTGDPELVDGKKYDVSLVKKVLKWKPMFETFAAFMEDGYKDEMKNDLITG